jgi:hypothetical protein
MKQLQNWYKTTIDTGQALNPLWRWPTVDKNTNVWGKTPSEVFDQQWLNHLDDLGIAVDWILIFYRPSGFQHQTAHIDVNGNEIETSALNLIVGGKHSEMRWYRRPDQPIKRSYNDKGIPYIPFALNQLEEIQRAELGGGLSLVRVDIPHAVFVADEPRWCISLRSKTRFASWQSAVESFDQRGLLLT